MNQEELKRILEEQARLRALENLQEGETKMPISEDEQEALRLQAGLEPLSKKKTVGPLRLSDMIGGANQRFKNLKDILYKKLMSQPEEQPSDSKKK